MSLDLVDNGDTGLEARTKINAAISKLNLPLPFLGPAMTSWERPALDIGGPGSAFNTWLNKKGNNSTAVANLAFTVGSPCAVNPGTDYDVGDTIIVAGGTASEAAVITVQALRAVSAAIVNAGSGGTPGSAIVQGTTGLQNADEANVRLAVTIGGGGTVSSIDRIVNRGSYTTPPTDLANEPCDALGGNPLTGFVISLVMGADRGQISTPGVYSVAPSNPVSQASSSGLGTGATWILRLNSRDAEAADHVNGPLSLLVDNAGNPGGVPCLTALLKDLGAPPWTITAGMAVGLQGIGYLNLDPIILYNSALDLAVSIKWYIAAAGAAASTFGPWYYDTTNPTAGSVLVSNPPNGSGPVVNPVSYFQWLRVQHDGTNLIFSISFENVLFLELARVPATQFAPSFDKVGFGIDRNSGIGQSFMALWSWIEE